MKKFQSFLACAVFAILACGPIDTPMEPLAQADDTDLAQYSRPAANAETANAANALTRPLLLVRDGKKITADSNAVGSAPINRSIKQLADAVSGVWCATFGNCAGVNSRTMKSLHVDGTGGAITAAAAGDAVVHGGVEAQTGHIVADVGDLRVTLGNIIAYTGFIKAISGDVVASIGNVQSLTALLIAGDPMIPRYAAVSKASLAYFGTQNSSAGANPPSTTATPNQLRALNIPKAWASFSTSGAVGTSCIVSDAHAIASVVRNTTKFTITFATPFDSAEYSATSGTTNLPQIFVDFSNKQPGSVDVMIYDISGYKDPVTVDTSRRIDVHFSGRQTT